MSDVKFIQGCQVHSVKLVVLPRSCSCKYGHYLCFIYFYLPLLRSKDNLKISSIQRTAILDSWLLVLYKLLADLLLISCHASSRFCQNFRDNHRKFQISCGPLAHHLYSSSCVFLSLGKLACSNSGPTLKMSTLHHGQDFSLLLWGSGDIVTTALA